MVNIQAKRKYPSSNYEFLRVTKDFNFLHFMLISLLSDW